MKWKLSHLLCCWLEDWWCCLPQYMWCYSQRDFLWCWLEDWWCCLPEYMWCYWQRDLLCCWLEDWYCCLLEFDVAIHRNLHLAAFFKVITEFCCNKMHKEADMTVVVILSHGQDGVVYASDGQSINMEYIYEFFNNRNCPNLMGKPKFFVVQACRGDRPDQGVEEEDKNEAHGQAKKRRAEALDGVAGDIGDVCRARPTWEDMIIAYSTIPGYASLRDHQHGTWFVQSLVEVFMTHSHDTELVDLLRMTSERLSHFTNEQGEKQTCNVEMRHLYKRIYFNPGLGGPPGVPLVTREQSMEQ